MYGHQVETRGPVYGSMENDNARGVRLFSPLLEQGDDPITNVDQRLLSHLGISTIQQLELHQPQLCVLILVIGSQHLLSKVFEPFAGRSSYEVWITDIHVPEHGPFPPPSALSALKSFRKGCIT